MDGRSGHGISWLRSQSACLLGALTRVEVQDVWVPVDSPIDPQAGRGRGRRRKEGDGDGGRVGEATSFPFLGRCHGIGGSVDPRKI